MNRRDALKSLVLGGLPFALAPTACAGRGRQARERARDVCWVTPEETQGPFYFDPGLARQDIRESKTGAVLQLVMNLVMDASCTPVANAMVDVWHCDKDGLYSGYNQPGGNTVGQNFLRGTQVSNASGTVRFTTIYPGWYPGRATHIHFKVRTASTTYKTSQFCFPEAANAVVYASPLYSGRGANPTSNSSDGIFHNAAPQYLTVAVTGDPGSGYTGDFTIGLDQATSAQSSTWGRFKSRYR